MRLVQVMVTAHFLLIPMSPAHAEPEPSTSGVGAQHAAPFSLLTTRAEQVSFDMRLRSLELSGNVRIDSGPFHLRSDRLTLERTRRGIEVNGNGQLAFCQCLGTPLRIDFDHAIVAPPGEIVVSSATVRIYRVPILYFPYFWLRSEEKVGLLPPEIAYRGQDGLFVGTGVHLPWDHATNALDLRGGVYAFSGFAIDARLTTEASTTKIRVDSLPGSSSPAPFGVRSATASPATTQAGQGLLIDAHGATSSGELGVAWQADVLRGARGVASTTEIDAAAKPWDRASAETSVHGGPLVVSTAMIGVTRRGGALSDIDAWGPVARVRASGAASAGIAYDVGVEGGVLEISSDSSISGSPIASTSALSSMHHALSFARAEAGALGATSFGPVAASFSLRGIVDVTAEPDRTGTDRAGSARARFALPMVRTFEHASAPNDPWIHLVEPFVEAAILGAKGDGMLGMAPGRGTSGVSGVAPVVEAGVATSLGRWGAQKALAIEAAGGTTLGSSDSGQRPLARARLSAKLMWVGATVDGAYVAPAFGSSLNSGAPGAGSVTVGRLRVGLEDGVRVVGNVAAAAGTDPILARVLVDSPLEPSAGFLAQQGTTGGAGVVVPWSRLVTTSVAADADVTSGELVDVRGGIELRDRCRCVTLRAMGAHRMGRSGIDAWVTVDFVTSPDHS